MVSYWRASNNAVGVMLFLSMSCISIPALGVTGVSGFNVEDFGVIKSVFFGVTGQWLRYLLDFF
jgi:hypothetical protein